MKREARSDHPAWLKAMSNGALGEARARAFLLDRFWVLERSVDVQGADLIIQRRLTGKNLLDREAPRLGVVQVKFFGTPTTSHFVHKEYVIDDSGDPREEFFLFCHTGNEENPRLYIVSGRELDEVFPRVCRDGNDGYAISHSQLAISRFEVTAPKYSLDRIERQLERAEFVKNRRFLAWALPSLDQDLAAIEPLYREPIDNGWGDIPEGFRKVKRAANRAMMNVEEIYELLGRVAEATDPLAAEEVVERIKCHCRDGYGRWSISLADGIYDPDLFQVCRRHKKIVDHLRADGLLDQYLKMKEALREELIASLAPRWPLALNAVHRLSMTYDPGTLLVASVHSTFADIDGPNGIPAADRAGSHELEKIEHSEPGRVDYRWLPARHPGFQDDAPSPSDFLRTTDLWMYYECMDAVFTMKYGETVG